MNDDIKPLFNVFFSEANPTKVNAAYPIRINKYNEKYGKVQADQHTQHVLKKRR